MGRYFVQAGNAAGLGENVLRDATTELHDRPTEAIARTRAKMAGWFEIALHEKLAVAIANRLPQLAPTTAAGLCHRRGSDWQ